MAQRFVPGHPDRVVAPDAVVVGSALCSASAAGPSAGLSASAWAADTGCGLVAAVRDFAAAAAAAASSALSRCATSCDTAPPGDAGSIVMVGVRAVPLAAGAAGTGVAAAATVTDGVSGTVIVPPACRRALLRRWFSRASVSTDTP